MNKVNDDIQTDIASLYRDGKTIKELCAKFKLTYPTVSRVLKNKNVLMRPRGRRKTIVAAPAVEATVVETTENILTREKLEAFKEKALAQAEALGFGTSD